MSAVDLPYASDGGARFATSRGPIGHEDIAFIRDCLRRDIPPNHIARMSRRALADVERVCRQIKQVDQFVVSPAPPVLVLSLFRGLIARKPTARQIIQDVADEHGVDVDALTGPRKGRAIAWPRQAAMHRLYETGRFSLPQIGGMLGGRDHTTVIHGIRRYKQRMAEAAGA